jgi:hypothetical protein
MACSPADKYFPHKEILAPKLMPLRGITNPFRLEIKHPFLIFENIKRTDSLYHIYDLNTHEFKSAFGIKGEGPEDFSIPWLYQTQNSDILIGDIGKNMLYRFRINEEGYIRLKDINRHNYINAAFINDSLYVADAMFDAPSLYLLSIQDDLPIKSWRYRNPDIRNYYEDPDKGDIYANSSRIILCYNYKKQIDFMDTGLNLIESVKFEFTAPPIINPENLEDINTSYGSGYLGKRYFYALYFGTSSKEFGDISYNGAMLEVFDLDGNPIVCYYLNGLPPTSFVIDEDTFTLYGVRDDGEPEDNILMYKLKGLS